MENYTSQIAYCCLLFPEYRLQFTNCRLLVVYCDLPLHLDLDLNVKPNPELNLKLNLQLNVKLCKQCRGGLPHSNDQEV